MMILMQSEGFYFCSKTSSNVGNVLKQICIILRDSKNVHSEDNVTNFILLCTFTSNVCVFKNGVYDNKC